MGSWWSSVPSEPPDMEGPLAKEVNTLINSNDVVIFSKTYCPYCDKAKNVFDSIQKKYLSIELNKRNDGGEIQAILGEMTGATTVPRVFVHGKCIGGGNDVESLHKSGGLEPLLN